MAELLHQLRELITTFVSAFNSNQEQRKAEAEFAPVLDAIVDPALQMCENSAALLSDKRYVAGFAGTLTSNWQSSFSPSIALGLYK